jgi:hypothetical protein
VRPGKSSEIIAPSLGTNTEVFRTDSLVDVTFLFALEAVQHIPTQNINVAGWEAKWKFVITPLPICGKISSKNIAPRKTSADT